MKCRKIYEYISENDVIVLFFQFIDTYGTNNNYTLQCISTFLKSEKYLRRQCTVNMHPLNVRDIFLY
jgi:hypothetical protein